MRIRLSKIVLGLRRRVLGAEITVRNLARTPLPRMGHAYSRALTLAAEKPLPDERDGLAADVIAFYQGEAFLADAVCEYIGGGLREGEAALIVCTAAHRTVLIAQPGKLGLRHEVAIESGQLNFLDAEQALARFMRSGGPEWNAFHVVLGAAIAEMHLQYPAVRAYGELVDLLWQAGQRADAIKLEEYWNKLAQLQTFSLLCVYYRDALERCRL